MACGECGKTKREAATVIAGPEHEGLSDGKVVPLVRELCPRCTFKHLSYAYVAMTEVDNGYPDHIALANVALIQGGFAPDASSKSLRNVLDFKARAVGHLVHAMEECPDKRLAEKIRSAYTAILDGDTAPDILSLLQELEKPNETT